MKTLTLLSVLSAMVIAACGGGIDGSKKLSELTLEETKDACLELVDDYPEKTVDCGGGVTITVGFTTAECNDNSVAPATCTATVDDARDCTEQLYNNTANTICMDKPLPASCMKLQACE
jgi:hypothetical protein